MMTPKYDEGILQMKMTLLALLLAALVGCGSSGGVEASDDISTVKNGVLADFNTTTVGKAFDGTFQDGKWTSFRTQKGVSVVQFTGIITADAVAAGGFVVNDPEGKGLWIHVREKCLDGVVAPCRLPVKFQFFMSADKKTFEVGYVDTQAFMKDLALTASPKRVLEFVYR
jgi:hypothetical protein